MPLAFLSRKKTTQNNGVLRRFYQKQIVVAVRQQIKPIGCFILSFFSKRILEKNILQNI